MILRHHHIIIIISTEKHRHCRTTTVKKKSHLKFWKKKNKDFNDENFFSIKSNQSRAKSKIKHEANRINQSINPEMVLSSTNNKSFLYEYLMSKTLSITLLLLILNTFLFFSFRIENFFFCIYKIFMIQKLLKLLLFIRWFVHIIFFMYSDIEIWNKKQNKTKQKNMAKTNEMFDDWIQIIIKHNYDRERVLSFFLSSLITLHSLLNGCM